MLCCPDISAISPLKNELFLGRWWFARGAHHQQLALDGRRCPEVSTLQGHPRFAFGEIYNIYCFDIPIQLVSFTQFARYFKPTEIFWIQRCTDMKEQMYLKSSKMYWSIPIIFYYIVHSTHCAILLESKTKRCYTYTGQEKDGHFYPLHVATESGRKNLAILLVKAGADVSLTDYR